jgi:2-polyprenyl-3-methyl-5-hydroxy-6-metoxy-1,4-benzoquinol methylase
MAEPLAKSPASAREYYDEYWSGKSGWRPTDQLDAQLKAWIDHCAWPGKSLLDVGCGDASRYAPYLLQQGFTLSGVDVSEEAVRAARERGVEATVAPLDRELPFSDSQFDGALCLEVFEHLLDPEFACREIFRTLRPGGLFLTSVPNSAALRNRIELLIL